MGLISGVEKIAWGKCHGLSKIAGIIFSVSGAAQPPASTSREGPGGVASTELGTMRGEAHQARPRRVGSEGGGCEESSTGPRRDDGTTAAACRCGGGRGDERPLRHVGECGARQRLLWAAGPKGPLTLNLLSEAPLPIALPPLSPHPPLPSPPSSVSYSGHLPSLPTMIRLPLPAASFVRSTTASLTVLSVAAAHSASSAPASSCCRSRCSAGTRRCR